MLRVIRLSIQNDEHCQAIQEEELHWVIILSLERDTDQMVLERMQALKLMKRIMTISPAKFPICFARSLVAISNFKDDSIRRVCLETLRELCVINPEIVALVNGFTCLLEAVLDPSLQDMVEPIVMSLLYLMGNQHTRKYVRPYLDLRILLSPFSDLDTDIADLMLRWKSAKTSFLLIMRSWIGIVILTSDPLGLSSLIGMLKDKRIPLALQDVIIESFIELFEPIISKGKTGHGKPQGTNIFNDYNLSTDYYNVYSTWFQSSEDPLTYSEENSTFNRNNSNNYNNSNSNSRYGMNMSSNSALPYGSSGGSGGGGTDTQDKSRMFSKSQFSATNNNTFNNNSNNNNIGSGGNSSSSNTNSYMNSFLKPKSAANTPNYKPNRKTSTSSGYSKNRSFSDASIAGNDAYISERKEYEDESYDRIYNLLDSYAAVLCCSFISCGIIESLILLGTQHDGELGRKARNLLLQVLRVVVRIFPESFCSELLTMPLLLEYNTTL